MNPYTVNKTRNIEFQIGKEIFKKASPRLVLRSNNDRIYFIPMIWIYLFIYDSTDRLILYFRKRPQALKKTLGENCVGLTFV